MRRSTKTSPCRRAILSDGKIIGWEEYTPPARKDVLADWAASPEGQAAYSTALLQLQADGKSWMELRPAISSTTGRAYWKRYDPEMYE